MRISELINILKLKFNKSQFSKNFLTLFSGSVIAQIIPLIASPFIARLFPPSEFGLLAIFAAIESFLLIFSSMQYELAIMLPEDDSEAFHLLILSLLITLIVTIISALTILIFNYKIAILLNSPELAGWLFLIPIEILILGSFKSLNVWASRYKKYRRISFRQITQSITQSVSKIIFGLLDFISGGLIVGMILGEFTSTLGLGRSTFKR
ncbi:MAG: oligosaccharide flippase family protein [Ignavibacteriales bacterium]|nr:oligosaccharide flippase family protein [Ignavibacteriales bacterium]